MAECQALPKIKIATGWDLSPLPWSFEACIAQDINSLWLLGETKFPVGKMPESPPKSYTEGLANFDVIEFFFADQNYRYIEYHIAPWGRWWMQTFTSPRQKDAAFKIPSVISGFDSSKSEGWSAYLKIPIQSFMGNLGTQPKSGNITATFKSQTTANSSLIRLPGDKANFHQPDYFAPIQRIEVN